MIYETCREIGKVLFMVAGLSLDKLYALLLPENVGAVFEEYRVKDFIFATNSSAGT